MNKVAISARASAFAVFLSVAMMTGLCLSCKSKKPTEPTFAINATSSAHGTIVPAGTISVNQGADQTFTMTADSGYNLVNLRIDGVYTGVSSTHTFTNVTANHSIYASFSHVYSIAATAGAHGTITPQGNVSVTEGAGRAFAIAPDFGYQISDVLVDGGSVGAASSYTFTNVTANHSISAVFTLILGVLSADSGLYYHGTMGSSVLSPHLILSATDSGGVSVNQWIHLSLLSGDGTLGADSVQTDTQGKAHPSYSLSGSKGHAVLRATRPPKDTLDLLLRANTMIWGDSAQGEYIKLGDLFSVVKGFDGLPERVDYDPTPGVWYTYAVYEGTRGVVVVLDDLDQDNSASDWEPVHAIILDSIYAGKFANGIGLGSTVGAVDTAFGTADTVFFDNTAPPPAWVYVYRTRGITFFADQQTPRRVFEIHLFGPQITQPIGRRYSTPTGRNAR